MSFPEFQVVLSPKAEEDIENILRYTGETWGEAQMLAYRSKLDEALQTLKRNPELGHKTDGLPDTHRLYPIGSHVIVYRLQKQILGVVRILHGRMSLPLHL